MTDPIVAVAAALLVGGVLLSKVSSRLGLPSVLLFLFLGMAAGSDGPGGLEFDDVDLARQFGIVALAFILFSGGLQTDLARVRGVAGRGLVLSTVGVLATAGVLGVAAAAVLDLRVAEGLLLGAIIAGTDAAAVFATLGAGGIVLRERVASLLELESGSNDPIAAFATVAAITYVTEGDLAPWALLGSFVVQMALGAAVGVAVGHAGSRLISRLRLEYDGLYPALSIGFVVLTFEATTWLGGSGFLACYVAGLVLGHRTFVHKRSLVQFHDGLGWLLQIGMFVVFGLLVYPTQLDEVAGRGLLLAALTVFVARPLAVALVLAPFRVPWREVLFVSWVGLRGATPIILATFPLTEGVPDAQTIFDVVFFVVLVSVLVQGTTVSAAARLLGVVDPEPPRPRGAFDAVFHDDAAGHLREVEVRAEDDAVGRAIVELGLPDGVLVLLIHRAGVATIPQGSTVLEAGDELLLLAERSAGHAEATRRIRTGQPD